MTTIYRTLYHSTPQNMTDAKKCFPDKTETVEDNQGHVFVVFKCLPSSCKMYSKFCRKAGMLIERNTY